MAALTVTAKGQITLRKTLLAHLGVGPGAVLDLQPLPGGRVEVRATRSTGGLSSFAGCLAGKTKRVATLEEIEAASLAGWSGASATESVRRAATRATTQATAPATAHPTAQATAQATVHATKHKT
jgi:antitoxin PrlF